MRTILFIILMIPSLLPAQFNKSLVFLSRYQKATQLNGTTQYWINADPANFNLGGYQMLMMAWVRQASTTGNQWIVSKYKSAAAGRSMTLGIESAVPIVYVSADGNGNASQISSVNSTAGRWMMLAATYSPSALNIYMNGVLANGGLTGSIPASLFDPTGTPLTVGVNGSLSTAFFNGTIGEVQVVRFGTLPSDIANTINSAYTSRRFPSGYTGGEIIFWTKWNGGGVDISGRNNHVTPTASPVIVPVKH